MQHEKNVSTDRAAELFGSPTQDGFEVLETIDRHHDGKISLVARLRHDAADAEFLTLRSPPARRLLQSKNTTWIGDVASGMTAASAGGGSGWSKGLPPERAPASHVARL